MGTEEDGEQRCLWGFFQSGCPGDPDPFAQFAMEITAVVQ